MGRRREHIILKTLEYCIDQDYAYNIKIYELYDVKLLLKLEQKNNCFIVKFVRALWCQISGECDQFVTDGH